MRGLGAFLIAAAVGCGVALSPLGARAQDDEEEQEEDDAPAGGTAAAGPQLDDATLRERLAPLANLSGLTVRDGVVTMAYPLMEPVELRAFESTGFDKIDLRNVQGQAQTGVGMEIGAGSRNTGRLLHNVPLMGDVDISIEMWVAHNTPSAVVCFLLSDKVGVLWGQQIVKPTNMRPYGRGTPADPGLCREERTLRSTFSVRGNEVVVTCNSVESSRYTFQKNELRNMRFGIIARNLRFVLTDLSIRGGVDTARLR
jgi:hypothetical protein